MGKSWGEINGVIITTKLFQVINWHAWGVVTVVVTVIVVNSSSSSGKRIVVVNVVVVVVLAQKEQLKRLQKEWISSLHFGATTERL